MARLTNLIVLNLFILFASAGLAHAGGACSKVNCTAAEALCAISLDTDASACSIYYSCCDSSGSSSGGKPQMCPNGAPPTCYPVCDVNCANTFGLTYKGVPTIATNLSPASASAANLTVEVAVNQTGQIYYNWWLLGQGGRGWSELSAGGQTHDDPAVSITANGYMFAAVRGLDGSIWINQGKAAGPFVGWNSAGFKSPYAPALSSSGMTTVAVAADSNGHIFYSSWRLGTSGAWKDLGAGPTNSKPAAALIGDYLFVVIRGPDGQLYLNQGSLGGPFVGWRSLGFSSTTAPAATSAGNTAVVVATGADGHLSYQWWTLGSAGTAWKELDGGGSWGSAPSAALTSKSYLFVAAKAANDNDLYLDQGQLGQPFVGWQKQ